MTVARQAGLIAERSRARRRSGLSVVDAIIERFGLVQITRASLAANPRNIRYDLEIGISELAETIRERGIIEPLMVCSRAAYEDANPQHPVDADATHVVLDGHRRRVASGLAGLDTLPCIVRDDLVSAGAAELQLVTQLHRANLGLLEEAELFEQMRLDLRLTQQATAQRVGVDQGTVSRRLSLLTLPDEQRKALREGDLSQDAALRLVRLKGDQLARVWALMHDQHEPRSATAAIEEVQEQDRHERARAKALRRLQEMGVPAIDPMEAFGSRHLAHYLHDDPMPQHRVTCLAAHVRDDGQIGWYCTDLSKHSGWRDVAAEADRWSHAVALLDFAGRGGHVGSAAFFADSVIRLARPGAAVRRAIALARERGWLPTSAPEGDGEDTLTWIAEGGLTGQARIEFAEALQLSAEEEAARRAGRWTRAQFRYLELLGEEYSPTKWERQELDRLAMTGEDL